ncbi:DJ-1/PfpI family protein [Mongoliitalea daihaiensis]|uniref:DJ-1/PfpI family protein n=1 Tax=Mongoliitalea daihaiensis TaxID=2782006 RepID=UPI001F303EE3|nr:DJ-1/PfpI family protein [Mongoliitalea daihaiensis]UJP65731.1 DJ-1/PfpI family protein [Mongoliitalea daihaiensis]
MSRRLQLGILAFQEMEVLDFAGPFEVFSVANQLADYAILDIQVIGLDSSVVIAKNGLKIIPDCSIEVVSRLDILIIPGGDGSKELLRHTRGMDWIYKISNISGIVATVCSGARILAQLGYLKEKTFTTHKEVFEDVLAIEPSAIPVRDVRYIDHGKIMTAAGVAAGIDLSLHIVEKLFGTASRETTARYMEYPFH